MDLFFQRIIDGLASGSIYAALGLALVLIYRTTATFNLAQGEMATFTAYLTWWMSDETGLGLPLGVGVAIAIAASFVLGGAIERVFIRPVEGPDNHLNGVIVTTALFIMINALTGWLFTTDTQRFPSLFPAGNLDIGGVTIANATLGLFAVLGALCISLWFLLQHTKLGLAMRAVSTNAESAGLVGVPVGRVLLVGWGLAAVVGGIAGILVAPRLFLTTGMMQGVLVYAFAAVALGGFDSLVGAIVGGIVIGIVESLVGGYVDFIGSQLKLSSAFLVLLLVLLLRPNGLFGRTVVARV